jgi:agmatinase
MAMRRVRLLGIPSDRHSSYLRGAAQAPEVIRAALRSEAGNLVAENGVEIGVDVALEDAGDVVINDTDADDGRIENAVRVLAAGAPAEPVLCLGGDHAITLPVIRALAAVHGPLEILHIDAHPDLYHDYEGNPRSHASPFARIMEQGLARRLVQVGIRTANRHQREQAARFGVETIAMREFSLARIPELAGPLYVSIDLDGLDPAHAPGVSHPEPGGLTVRELLAVLHAQRAPLVGADIVELNPARDLNGVTALVAAKLLKELCSVADRRVGAPQAR